MRAIVLLLLVLSLRGAQEFIDSDPAGCIMDWSFLLASHGYDVPEPGVLRVDGATYAISETGVIA